ncbi:GntR family transcriptional regulator [Streptomyces sp. HNM0575]|uniref:GntR family transcriptional regulator n=1 Tax=Streptomyces sp. HNM0575 TaxID=2716338 RepID=UPI00145CB46F|nr:GntR family transcriptional regulator [Streptomyces sp. HNM0575]NLU74374.1 GntR family transcriptional regulator [Streptomyces sp. HNM0575]
MAMDTGAAARPDLLGRATSQSDLVVQWLRTAILTGRFEPDEVLVERRLSEQLGISKTPVREALIMLSTTGLVTVNRNQRVRVRRLTVEDARHVYEQRILLEPWAVAEASRSGRADFREARDLMEDAERLATTDDTAALVTTNRDFHRALYAQCQNRLVVGTLDGLQDLTALAALTVFWELAPTWQAESVEHHDIYKAAVDGRADEAGALMRKHIERSLVRLSEHTGAGG